MFIGYVRVSKSDDSQSLDLQRDVLKEAGVVKEHIYHDMASGEEDDRPGLVLQRYKGSSRDRDVTGGFVITL